MRVLEVMESTIGGTRRHLVDLAGGLLAAGDEVHLCVSVEREPRFAGDLKALAELGAEVHVLPMGRSISPRRDWAQMKQLTELVRRIAPEVVHTHSSKAGVLGRMAAARGGCGATVHTPHTFAFLFDAMFSAPKRQLFRAIEMRLARRTTRVIAVSEGEASTMVRAGVVEKERVRVVGNGVAPASWQGVPAVERSTLDLGETAPVILVAGLLNAAKGQDLAILGVKDCPDAQLVLAGHGDDLPALQELVRKHELEDRVSFLGWRDDLPALMAMADIVLLPSRWEGMPYVVLEAMAAGKPVVATRVDGAVDLVADGETGFLVEVGDTAAMGAALGKLIGLGPQAMAAMGAAGAQRVRSHYTIEHMVDGTRAVFREAIQEAKRKRA